MGASRLEVPAGLLPAGDSRYRFQLTASKGSRSDTAEATVHVLAGAAPTGKIRCVRWAWFGVGGQGVPPRLLG